MIESTGLNEIDAAIESLTETDEEPIGEDGHEGEGEKKGDDSEAKKEKEMDEGEEEVKTDGEDEKQEEDDKNKDEVKPVEPISEKPKRNRYQERIDTLTRDRYELQRELDDLRGEIESKPPEMPKQPDPRDYQFKTDDEKIAQQRRYDYDMGIWTAKCEAIKAEHEQRDQRRIASEQERIFSKMSHEKSIFGDYHDSIRALSHLPMTPELHEALKNDENPADLFCFLGSNPKIAEGVLKLTGYQQTRKLAEISYKLNEAKNRPKVQKSAAPSPVGKPKGGNSGGGEKKIKDLSFEEHCAMMRKLEVKRRKQLIT